MVATDLRLEISNPGLQGLVEPVNPSTLGGIKDLRGDEPVRKALETR